MSLSRQKREAVGGQSDPVVLDDSSDEEEVDEDAAVPRKRARISRPQTFKFPGKRTFCLILMVEPDDECKSFLEDCKKNCSNKQVHESCFQRDGTLHFTLFNKTLLTYQQAMALSIDPIPSSLPVMNLTGFTNWPTCVALTTCTSIEDVVSSISPPISRPSNLHLSLYRNRSRKNWGEIKKQFDSIRRNVDTSSFGTARGTRIILKEVGADYFGHDEGRFFRVLVETSKP